MIDMIPRAILLTLAYCLMAGCVGPKSKAPVITYVTPPYQQYFAGNIHWPSIQRVVLMPLANQTEFPRIVDEMQANLVTEIQRAGRFEIVAARHEDPGARARDIFQDGQFDELEVLRIAREYQADAVLFANITQYSPYARPKLGVSLLLINPAEGVAIGSVRGVWDTREENTAAHAQSFIKQNQNWPRSLMGSERVFDSPDVFQRYVCQQIAVALYPSAAGAMTPVAAAESMGATFTETSMPPNSGDIPPLPPGAFNESVRP